MKIALFSSFIASFGMTASSLSHADVDNGGFFVDGSVGRTRLNKNFDENFYFNDTSDTGYGINGGYRWALNPSIAIGIEGGYACERQLHN